MPKMISEYGGKEKYPSKAAMKKHEKAESPAMERREKKMAKGGKVSSKEGTAKDMREDKAMAKKRGMSMAEWEKSAADKKHDAPKKMAKGGSVRGTGAAKRGKGFSGCY